MIQKVYGPKATYLALGSLVTGHLLFVLAIYSETHWLLFAGRVFIGFGGEGMCCSQVYNITSVSYTHLTLPTKA